MLRLYISHVYVYASVALPFDAAKTVIQATKVGRGQTAPGVAAAISRLLSEGGPRRLFLGWPVAVGRGVPGAAITLLTYSHVARALTNQ